MTEVVAIALRRPEIPPVVKGAGDLIRRLSEEEAKIEAAENSRIIKKNISVPPESIATIIFKYGNQDIYKDVYKFIKT